MPITDYDFSDRVFFAKESDLITGDEANTWARKLAECALASDQPIVALVDALEVRQVSVAAHQIFTKASFTANLLAVVVATNDVVRLTATTIGMLGKRGKTVVFPTLEKAREYTESLLNDNAHKHETGQNPETTE